MDYPGSLTRQDARLLAEFAGEPVDDLLFEADLTEQSQIASALVAPIPVPLRTCPLYTTVPQPGCFYQIQYGGGGLLTTTSRAYGFGPGQERLRLAGKINDHPYNQRFWRQGQWPFEDGQIDFLPRFKGTFEGQAGSGETSTKAPPGGSFAILWIPPLEPSPKPVIFGCGDHEDVLLYWQAAARHAFDAWRRLEELRAASGDVQLALWKIDEQVWFGRFSPNNLRVVLRRMERIERLFRKEVVIECIRKNNNWGRAYPGIRRIKLGRKWMDSTDRVEKVETLLHEMAHIAGLGTYRFDVKKGGKQQAREEAENRPDVARRNAENYGWYAISQSLFPSFRRCAEKDGPCGETPAKKQAELF